MKTLQDLLLGRYTGVDELHASPWSDQETATVNMSATAELDGALIVMRITETRSTGTFEAVNLFMTDRDSDEVLLYAFDSLGYAPDPPARGVYADAQIELHRSTPRGDSRTIFAGAPAGLRWSKHFRASPDAPWQAVVTGTLRRV